MNVTALPHAHVEDNVRCHHDFMMSLFLMHLWHKSFTNEICLSVCQLQFMSPVYGKFVGVGFAPGGKVRTV